LFPFKITGRLINFSHTPIYVPFTIVGKME
jgi:hypothetical protein